MKLHERLLAARKHANFQSAREAADALGVPYPTYAGHENGSSGFRAKSGELYARRFKVRFEWLMSGRGPMVDNSALQQEIINLYDKLPPEQQELYLQILRNLAASNQGEAPPEAPPQKSGK